MYIDCNNKLSVIVAPHIKYITKLSLTLTYKSKSNISAETFYKYVKLCRKPKKSYPEITITVTITKPLPVQPKYQIKHTNYLNPTVENCTKFNTEKN
jgi:hypothetical protein